jgi:hypothetical protein
MLGGAASHARRWGGPDATPVARTRSSPRGHCVAALARLASVKHANGQQGTDLAVIDTCEALGQMEGEIPFPEG